MKDDAMSAEALRNEGMKALRANEPEQALVFFDQALAAVETAAERDDDLHELIVINKAGALITLERSGSEVQQLTQILMRRRTPRHRFLAAYNVHNKFAIEGDFKRATFYAQLALETAREANETEWQIDVLFALGILHGLQSRFPEAIAAHLEVLELGSSEVNALRVALTHQNLGYSYLMDGSTERGISLIHQAIEEMIQAGSEGFVAESYLDLCLGYLETGELDKAKKYGELGLEKATETRQVRNGHYLLGEVAYKSGDTDLAGFHFEHLARYYPDFPNLQNLLFAIDLRGFVNFKL